jgi:hypothetical protein
LRLGDIVRHIKPLRHHLFTDIFYQILERFNRSTGQSRYRMPFTAWRFWRVEKSIGVSDQSYRELIIDKRPEVTILLANDLR